jgi:general secretion pathway protein F
VSTTGYRYRAATTEGQVVEGIVQASSQPTALEELRRQRLVPIDVKPAAPAQAGRGSLPRTPALALFARTVSTMLSAGVPLDRALAFGAAQARHPDVGRAARHVQQAVQGGARLSDALAQHPGVFGALFVALVAAGEESGALDESMARVADHLDERVELRAQIRSALLYPALMAFASGAGITILLLFVVPRFAGMFEEAGGALPLSTRMLIGVSDVVVRAWWLFATLGIGLALAARAWLARPENRRRWHGLRLTWPLSGELELKYATARFTRALGMLLRSGRPILPALRAARASVSNLSLDHALAAAAEAVSHGQRLHVALNGTLPALATELIAVGEETSRLDDLCLRVADAYDVEVRRTLRSLVAVIEPALILLFAVVVGFIALAMLQAIYGLNASVL